MIPDPVSIGARVLVESLKLGRPLEARVREWSPSGKYVSVEWTDTQANGIGAFDWMKAADFKKRLVEVLRG